MATGFLKEPSPWSYFALPPPEITPKWKEANRLSCQPGSDAAAGTKDLPVYFV